MSHEHSIRVISMMDPVESLAEYGYAFPDVGTSENLNQCLREAVFAPGIAGKRCLLTNPNVSQAAIHLQKRLTARGLLSDESIAVQAIAFDKSPAANWKVAWHQDLMFPFKRPVNSPGYSLPCIKDGVHFARPPVEVLSQLLAVRLHLDECDERNGPLRVSPGTHRLGIIPPEHISHEVRRHGQKACLVAEGQTVLMRPLLLHASSQADEPRHRRILHFVFYSGPPTEEPWAQSVRISQTHQ